MDPGNLAGAPKSSVMTAIKKRASPYGNAPSVWKKRLSPLQTVDKGFCFIFCKLSLAFLQARPGSFPVAPWTPSAPCLLRFLQVREAETFFSCVYLKKYTFLTVCGGFRHFFEEATSANQRSSEVVRNGFCLQNQRPAPPAKPADTNGSRRGNGFSDTSQEFFGGVPLRERGQFLNPWHDPGGRSNKTRHTLGKKLSILDAAAAGWRAWQYFLAAPHRFRRLSGLLLQKGACLCSQKSQRTFGKPLAQNACARGSVRLDIR